MPLSLPPKSMEVIVIPRYARDFGNPLSQTRTDNACNLSGNSIRD
jgi:hypothetical protein